MYDVYIFRIDESDEVFITSALMKVFNYDAHVAAKIMLDAVLKGKALAWTGTKQVANDRRNELLALDIDSQICKS